MTISPASLGHGPSFVHPFAGGAVAGSPLGGEKVQLLGIQGDHRLGHMGDLAVQADGHGLPELQAHMVGLNPAGHIGIAPGLAPHIVAGHAQKGAVADPADDQRVQPAVVQPGVGNGHDAAAVVAAVAHAHHGVIADGGAPVAGDGHAVGDLLEKVDAGGGQIGARTGDHGILAVFMHVVGHPGVQAGADDGGGHPAVAFNQIQVVAGRVPQLLQIQEAGAVLAEVFHKVVAGAHGHHGDFHMLRAPGAVDDFVEGAVAAAGVNAHGFAAVRGPAGGVLRIAPAGGQHDLALDLVPAAQGLDLLHQAGGGVFLAGPRVDDKQVFHGNASPLSAAVSGNT